MCKKIYVILILIFLNNFSLLSQTPSYYHYSTTDGLASASVFSIVQDMDGFIWFGTQNGMSKFDGKRFITLGMNDGLNSNVITSLITGEAGEIYIGNYEKGINILKNGIVENYCNKINGKNFSTGFLIKTPHKLYAQYSSGSLAAIGDRASSDTIDYFIKTDRIYVNRLVKLPDNSLLALTKSGLYNLTNDNLIKYDLDGLPDSDYFSLAVSSDGSYYIGATGIIYKVKNNRVIKKYSLSIYNNKYIYQIFCDKNDNIWFSVLGKGFFVIPNGSDKIINLGRKMGLDNTQVNGFFEDKEKNIWISTYSRGVYCLNNLFITGYTEKDGLNNNYINSIIKDDLGRLLVGTINGISVLDNDVLEKVKSDSGNSLSGYIFDMQTYNDSIYVCWAPETPQIKNVTYKKNNLRMFIIPSFHRTSDGLNLFGTWTNLLVVKKSIDSKKYNTLYILGENANTNRINKIYEDSRRNIWVGTSEGLCRIIRSEDKSEISSWKKSFFTNDSVLNSKINSIYQDNNNNIWFAGVKGIARYNLNNDSLVSYTKILGHDLVSATSLASDNKNRIWIGSLTGLYLFDGKSIKQLNSNTGLTSDEVYSLFYDNQNNLLYIGTNAGLSVLDVKLFDNYKAESLEVKINNIKAGETVFTNFNQLSFEPEQNNVFIDFIALSFSSPRSVKYKYNLNGVWEETEDNFLKLISLKHGVYDLQIMAKAQNIDWGKPISLRFEILPRFDETIWFKSSIILLIVLLAISVVAWRQRIKNNKIRQELNLTERINELKHQALSAMMNPHFIFNSLNSVQYLINCQRNEEANDYIASLAKLIRKNLETAGNGFILLTEEINRLKLYLDLEKLRFQEKISYEIITGADVEPDHTLIPNMIIQPFAENTLWHGIIDSGEQGKLTISFTFENVDVDSVVCTALIIKITDNGVGINAATMNKKEDHISKGISIIEERLKLLSTKMQLPQPILFEDLSNRDGSSHGTEVIISLPEPLFRMVDKY